MASAASPNIASATATSGRPPLPPPAAYATTASATSETTPTSRSISTEATASGAAWVRRASSTARTASPPIAAGRNWPRNSATKYVRVSHAIGTAMPLARSSNCHRQAITGIVATLTSVAAAIQRRSAAESVSQICAGSVNQSSAASTTAETMVPRPSRTPRLIS